MKRLISYGILLACLIIIPLSMNAQKPDNKSNKLLFLLDLEFISFSEPSADRADSGLFSDADYVMTALPIECKIIVFNKGSWNVSDFEVTLKIYRENTVGDWPEEPTATVRASASVVSLDSIELSFDLADVEADRDSSSKIFKTYSDLRNELPAYNVPEHFRGPMEANVTPRYKIDVEIKDDEDTLNNKGSTTDPGDDVESGKLNYDRLSYGFSRLRWYTDIDRDILYDDDDLDDSLKIDAFDRNSWEPRSVDYTIYEILFLSDGHDKALTEYQKLDINNYVNSGEVDNYKSLVIGSQEIVTMNAFKMIDDTLTEDQQFINITLRCRYKSDLGAWPEGTDEIQVLGFDIDREQVRSIEMTTALKYDWDKDGNSENTISDDPMPMCSLTDPYTQGPGLARKAYVYFNDGNKSKEDSTIGVSTEMLDRRICVLSVDWRHWSDIESILRACIDFIEDSEYFWPVELTAFEANATANKVNLSWTTASEINSDRFEVERAELNEGGKSPFATIATVPAFGNCTNTRYYGPVTDTDVLLGKTYIYQLNMIDADGTSERSEQRLVTIGTSGSLVLGKASPSPATSSVSFETNAPSDATVLVYDASGRVFVPKYDLVAGKLSIDITTLSSGVYILLVKSNKSIVTQTFRVVK
jgi:hypothetical protein